ncbi:carbohydrate-binding family 9-like protein [Antarcticibacterium sp. 1MA-6-2]|uniref:carbohydrate-binding family 9-like protein n=1 Tax=Antarcticibacterium sp. 1MA-6-2 TaxID=2908210 RepID=UPI001F24ECF5|nr:carbohydrate-binding family 9-like protein [Antarcticibacterium sp. 1MA-6-2]UJH90175.1 carbohydrate-binding family 9-like protein [Antarcticibacterium sp. 1MA-6-2]
MNHELPILVSNENGDLVRWQPFHYDEDRKTRHATSVKGGEKQKLATISGWTAEFFIPYKLLRPLNNIPPVPGTRWRANFYRVDYDHPSTDVWSWQETGESFHEYKEFGLLLFE